MMTNLVVPESTLSGILHKILTFMYYLAHQIGLGVVKILRTIFTQNTIPDTLIDPFGFLIILTLFILLAGISKRIAWIILVVAWVLLLIRILLILFKLG